MIHYLVEAVDRRITICRGSNHHIRVKLAFSPVVKALSDLSLEESEKRKLKIIGSFGSVYKLRLFLDGAGISRVRGRLQNSSSDYQSKHPLLLPSEHHVTKLLITDVRESVGHLG